MIQIPEQFVVQKLYENVHKLKFQKFNNTYNGCCPFCREGKSWGIKKRFFYIPEKEVAFCHNCGYSKKPFQFLMDLNHWSVSQLIEHVKGFDSTIDITEQTDISSFGQNETKQELPSLPDDCINLTDRNQVEYYKNEPVVKKCLELIESRHLLRGVNSPKALYVSLKDFTHKNRLVLPFYDESGKIVFYQTRSMLPNDTKSKYISKIGAEKSLYGIHNVSVDLDYLFIFEGPIDSYFVQNGLATCGITDKSKIFFTQKQQEQIDRFRLHEKIFVFDSQWQDSAALKKSKIAIDEGYKVFIWPELFGKRFKDMNEMCVYGNIDKVDPEFILKNTHSGLKGEILLKQV